MVPKVGDWLMDFVVAHFEQILFYTVAALTVAGGVGVIALKNPVHAALSLLWTFLMVAVLFVLRHAEFLAAVQVLVYAGGIMVLFLFVIMLVNVRGIRPESVFLSQLAPLAIVAGVLVGALLAFVILIGVFAASPGDVTALQRVGEETPGNTEAVGMVLYTRYLVPFEVVSVVLLVAMIGAIIFGRRDAAVVTDRQGGHA
jgi:NADH-quinone oxidoreductase subunit J